VTCPPSTNRCRDLGQHNRQVFGGLLGLSDAEINLLIEEKVIY
jgi:crotonobetainyl-CoA:carnitine CoA-transferase CaiB-like acyl-CoA transferase